MVDRKAALRQLTWALHLILARETASVNSRRNQVISSSEDERLASPGPCPREDYPLYILHTHSASYTYTNKQIYKLTQLYDLYCRGNTIITVNQRVHTWSEGLTPQRVKPCLWHDRDGVTSALHHFTSAPSNRLGNYRCMPWPFHHPFNTGTNSLDLAPLNEQVLRYVIMRNSISISRGLESKLWN